MLLLINVENIDDTLFCPLHRRRKYRPTLTPAESPSVHYLPELTHYNSRKSHAQDTQDLVAVDPENQPITFVNQSMDVENQHKHQQNGSEPAGENLYTMDQQGFDNKVYGLYDELNGNMYAEIESTENDENEPQNIKNCQTENTKNGAIEDMQGEDTTQ